METQAFVQIVEKCSQDSPSVVMLMEHALATLKRENADINRAFYRQDNAGCYHAAYTILACKEISKELTSEFNVWTFLIPREEKDPAIDLLQL